MVIFNTALLVKDVSKAGRISKLNKFRTILGWLAILFLPAFWIVGRFNESAYLSVIFTFILYLAVYAICSLYVGFVLKSARARQALDCKNEYDALIYNLGQKYERIKKRHNKIVLIFVLLAVIFFIIGVAAGVVQEGTEGENLPAITFMFIVFVVICIFAPIIVITFSQMRFASRELSSIEELKRLSFAYRNLSTEQIIKENRTYFGNVAESQRILSYIYPDESIRNRAQKQGLYIVIPAVIMGIVMGLTIVFGVILYTSNTLLLIGAGIFLVCFALMIALSQNRTLKLIAEQRKLLDADKDKNVLYIRHADETKKYTKHSNFITYIFSAIIAVILMVTAIIVPLNFKGLVLLVGFVVFFIGCIIILSLTRPKYRKIVKPIEDLIDEERAKKIADEKVALPVTDENTLDVKKDQEE